MIKPQGRQRISKEDMYLNSAENFAYRSTCLKRKYGAVIVKDDAVISTGYNGSPRGFENCCDIGVCPRMQRNMHQGEGYGMCRAIHAEANAVLTTDDGYTGLTGATTSTGLKYVNHVIYLTGGHLGNASFNDYAYANGKTYYGDQNTLNVARRTCGYIGCQGFNAGRTAEIRDRVLHL